MITLYTSLEDAAARKLRSLRQASVMHDDTQCEDKNTESDKMAYPFASIWISKL